MWPFYSVQREWVGLFPGDVGLVLLHFSSKLSLHVISKTLIRMDT